jgi:hypothetical protein
MREAVVSKAHSQGFIVGLAACVSAALVLTVPPDVPTDVTSAHRNHPLSPSFDLQRDGPLLDAAEVTVKQAKAQTQTPYELPMPPTNKETAERTGVWIERTDQVAFVWKTDLTFLAEPLRDWTEKEAVETWTRKAETGEGKLVSDKGNTGFAYDDGSHGNPTSITFIERGLVYSSWRLVTLLMNSSS